MSTVHTVLEGLLSVYCVHGNNGLENSYQPIPHFVCNIEALLLGFILLQTLEVGL